MLTRPSSLEQSWHCLTNRSIAICFCSVLQCYKRKWNTSSHFYFLPTSREPQSFLFPAFAEGTLCEVPCRCPRDSLVGRKDLASQRKIQARGSNGAPEPTHFTLHGNDGPPFLGEGRGSWRLLGVTRRKLHTWHSHVYVTRFSSHCTVPIYYY